MSSDMMDNITLMSSDMMDILGMPPEVSPINIMDFLLDESINITEKENEINDLTDIDEILCEQLNIEDNNLNETSSLKYNKSTKEIFYNTNNLIKTENIIKENQNTTTRNMYEESTYDQFCTTDDSQLLLSICPNDLNIKKIISEEHPSTSTTTTTPSSSQLSSLHLPSLSSSDIFEESFDYLSNTEGIFASQISNEGIHTQDLCLFKDTDYDYDDNDCNNKSLDHNYSLINENNVNSISSNDKHLLIHNNDPMVCAGSVPIKNILNQNNSDNNIIIKKNNNFDTIYVIDDDDDDSSDSYEENDDDDEEEEKKIMCNSNNNDDDDKSSIELIENHNNNMLIENQSNSNKRKTMFDVATEENIDYKKSRIDRFKAIKSLKLNLNQTNNNNNNVKQEINTPDIYETVLNLEAEQNTTSGSANNVGNGTTITLNVAAAASTSSMYNQLQQDLHEENHQTISSSIFDFDEQQQQIDDDDKPSIISPPDTPITIIENDNHDSRQQLLSPISSSIKFENPSSVQSYISDDYYGTSSLNSVATTIINPVQKKSRGRPPKPHSDRPDPNELANLSESEKRYRLQRYKNNNASRQSRLNRKEKNEKHKEEENRLTTLNKRLRYEAEKYERIQAKLEKFLRDIIQPKHP